MTKDKGHTTAKTEDSPVPADKIVTVEVPDSEIRADQELDTKFGSRQSIGGKVLENLTEKQMSRPEPKRPSEDDMKSDHCEWVRHHFNRVAGKDIKARVERDEWDPKIIHVEVRGRPGSISVDQIESLRRSRSLDAISLAMQAFLAGYLPEYKLTDEQLYGAL